MTPPSFRLLMMDDKSVYRQCEPAAIGLPLPGEEGFKLFQHLAMCRRRQHERCIKETGRLAR